MGITSVCLFVCLFMWRHSLLTRVRGHTEVKDTCLRLVKEFRKGGGTAQHMCVRVN